MVKKLDQKIIDDENTSKSFKCHLVQLLNQIFQILELKS